MKFNYKLLLKFILIVFITTFTFLGCTTKNQSSINSYIIQHKSFQTKINKINFNGVIDKRDIKTVSEIYINNKVFKKFGVDVNIKQWYLDAFNKELNKLNIIDKQSKIIVDINIKKLYSRYDKYKTNKDNLKAYVSLELVIKNGTKISKVNVNLNQTMYKFMITDAEGFEIILNDIMKNSVTKSIKVLLSKLQ